jgi:hypothetical protein
MTMIPNKYLFCSYIYDSLPFLNTPTKVIQSFSWYRPIQQITHYALRFRRCVMSLCVSSLAFKSKPWTFKTINPSLSAINFPLCNTKPNEYRPYNFLHYPPKHHITMKNHISDSMLCTVSSSIFSTASQGCSLHVFSYITHKKLM